MGNRRDARLLDGLVLARRRPTPLLPRQRLPAHALRAVAAPTPASGWRRSTADFFACVQNRYCVQKYIMLLCPVL
jgi:hypothetical protein